jgi:cell division protease FtsH
MKQAQNPRFRLSILVGLLLLFFVISRLMVSAGAETLAYSEFLTLVEEGQVVDAAIGETQIDGTYTKDGEETDFTTVRPPGVDDQELISTLQENGVEFTGSRPSGLSNFVTNFLLGWILPLAVLIGIWIFLFRRFQGGAGGAMRLGQSKHKVFDRSELKTTFQDVAGVDEAVEELREVVDFLKNPSKYQKLGGRIPKGVLLAGSPGTGKTLLARAVAGEAQVKFFYLSGSSFVELFVGLGAARVRDLFEQAKANAPCIIFIDEIDTIGKSRGGAVAGGFGGHDEREQTLNQLLTEMDGFDASKGVIIMAATNRPEVLDPALLRPGRFDRQVIVNLPDRKGREAILRVHARDVVLGPGVDLGVVAARTPGASGADLANIVNEAALLAARGGKTAVGQDELEEAVDRVSLGLERRSLVLRPEERERVAYHELGHALVALALPRADPVHRVSIVPRGVAALGVTQQLPAEDRYLITQPELEDRLAVLMGGRAAEKLVYGEYSTGAHNDLQQATMLARRMVAEFGMSDKVGPVALARPSAIFLGADGLGGEPISPEVAAAADSEVRRLTETAEERAESILVAQREALTRLARVLLEREELDGSELRAELAVVSAPPAAAAVRADP